ncbi:MAG: helix-turn-helix domain-containing protein [Eubacteriales bacterium]|nr:helix-turn-helix domain-containing protein [Eubacteriales bacterium]
MLNYKKFWDLLESRKISQYSLMKRRIISGSSLSAMKNNDYVSVRIIERLCIALNCKPEDIVEKNKYDQL